MESGWLGVDAAGSKVFADRVAADAEAGCQLVDAPSGLVGGSELIDLVSPQLACRPQGWNMTRITNFAVRPRLGHLEDLPDGGRGP